jgi:hypothetical protein
VGDKSESSVEPTLLLLRPRKHTRSLTPPRCVSCCFMAMLPPPAPGPAPSTSHRLEATMPRSDGGTTASWSLGCGAAMASASGSAGSVGPSCGGMGGGVYWGLALSFIVLWIGWRRIPPRQQRCRMHMHTHTSARTVRSRQQRVVVTDVLKIHRHDRARRLAAAPTATAAAAAAAADERLVELPERLERADLLRVAHTALQLHRHADGCFGWWLALCACVCMCVKREGCGEGRAGRAP